MTRRRDFTLASEPIEFTVDGDVFRAPPILPAPALLDLHAMQRRLGDLTSMTPEQTLTLLHDIFELLLVAESAQRFRDRLVSRDRPLDLKQQVLPILMWLVEEYTGRPTRPSSTSADGSTTSGGGSTDGAPPVASTPAALTPTGSAT